MKTSRPDSTPASRRTSRRFVARALANAAACVPLCEGLESRLLLSSGPPVVAVLDTGVNIANVIAGQLWVNPHESSTPVGVDADLNGFPNDVQGWNFSSSVTVANGVATPNGTLGDNITTDSTTHGTNMSQAILNSAISVGDLGGVQILPVKIATAHSTLNTPLNAAGQITSITTTNAGVTGNETGTPTVADVLAAGITYAVRLKVTEDVNIVAMTMDMGGIVSRNADTDPALFNLRSAIRFANDNGIVMLTGAGNSSSNNDVVSNYPANFASEFNLLIPVAATDGAGNLLPFSNISPTTVKLGAPGLVTVLNTGANATTTVVNGSEFAAAEVAGAIAGLISSHPDISPSQALAFIMKGLTPNPSLQFTTVSGGALLNFQHIAEIAASAPPVGAIESLTNASVSGYVYDVDEINVSTTPPFTPPAVTLVIDGNIVASDIPASTPRADILPFTLPANNPTGLIPPTLQIAGGFSINFGPLLAGPHTISIYARDLPSNDLSLIATRTINNTVPTMVLTGPDGRQIVQSQNVDFGNVTEGSQADNIFTVTNTGNVALSVFTPTLPPGYSLVKDTSHLINPGQSDTFIVRLDSTTSGLFNGSITVNSNDPTGLALTFGISGAVGASFLTNLYETLLHRAPDLAGLAFWNQQLASHAMTTTQVAAEFINSTEYHTILVQNLYISLLHRAADSSGLAGWVTYLDGGGTLEGAQISFLSSDEYYAVHGLTAQSVVGAFYQDIFGRPVDAAGLAAWSGQILAGAPRSLVVTSLFYSPEGLAHTVDTTYLTYLGRTADLNGQAFWTNQLGSLGVTQLQMAASLLGSQEFFIRP